MIAVRVSVDTTQLLLRLRNGERRLAYAVAGALNATARDIQAAEHENVRRKFIVRNERFLFGSPGRPGGAAGRISPFANAKQGRPFVEVSVSASTMGGSRRLLLGIFEEGGERKPFTPGAQSVAVPLEGRPARPSIRRGVPPQYTFQGLRFRAFHRGRRMPVKRASGSEATLFGEYGRRGDVQRDSGIQWKGAERTFILTHTKREEFGGVFQRIGPKRGDIREIYAFRRGIQLPSRLGFIAIARRVTSERFQSHLEDETIRSITYSGRRGL